jgi:hypothetical protein
MFDKFVAGAHCHSTRKGELMPKSILIDEIHITVFAPIGLRKADDSAIRRTLRSKRFESSLRNAVRDVFRQYPPLKKSTFRMAR